MSLLSKLQGFDIAAIQWCLRDRYQDLYAEQIDGKADSKTEEIFAEKILKDLPNSTIDLPVEEIRRKLGINYARNPFRRRSIDPITEAAEIAAFQWYLIRKSSPNCTFHQITGQVKLNSPYQDPTIKAAGGELEEAYDRFLKDCSLN